MKLIHLSDLHIGKRVNEFPMIEDQKYILIRILNIIDEVKPDGILIAGDVYDKSVPSAEAVGVLDDFIYRLSERKIPVFIISGNHDSAERLAFNSRLIDLAGIHISPAYNGKIEPYKLADDFGEVNLYMLPFVKPSAVRSVFQNEEISSYDDAVRVAINKMEIDPDSRNVLVAHQFVTGAERSDSEEQSVGGLDNVDASAFDGFDYVALGHIHGPQNIGSKRIRYCGTPLKYSFSEAGHKKSVTVVELKGKGELEVSEIPLIPKHDMVEIRGTYEELTFQGYYENTTLREDYVHITLTDEDDIPFALSKLRVIYQNLMKLDYDNIRTRHSGEAILLENVEQKSAFEIFGEFYNKQNGTDMNDEQSKYMKELIDSILGDEA